MALRKMMLCSLTCRRTKQRTAAVLCSHVRSSSATVVVQQTCLKRCHRTKLHSADQRRSTPSPAETSSCGSEICFCPTTNARASTAADLGSASNPAAVVSALARSCVGLSLVKRA